LATKSKVEALSELVGLIEKYGEIETKLKMADIQSFDYQQMVTEDIEKNKAYQEANKNEFLSKLLGKQMDQFT